MTLTRSWSRPDWHPLEPAGRVCDAQVLGRMVIVPSSRASRRNFKLGRDKPPSIEGAAHPRGKEFVDHATRERFRRARAERAAEFPKLEPARRRQQVAGF